MYPVARADTKIPRIAPMLLGHVDSSSDAARVAKASLQEGGTPVLTRLIGSDAVIEFSTELLELIGRVEATFPAPEWAVLFNDAEEEDESDELVICRRYSGVFMPVSYVDLDEIAEMEQDSFDWLKDLAADLTRTEAELEEEIAASEAEEKAE
jgi:hypothetical protein